MINYALPHRNAEVKVSSQLLPPLLLSIGVVSLHTARKKSKEREIEKRDGKKIHTAVLSCSWLYPLATLYR